LIGNPRTDGVWGLGGQELIIFPLDAPERAPRKIKFGNAFFNPQYLELANCCIVGPGLRGELDIEDVPVIRNKTVSETVFNLALPFFTPCELFGIVGKLSAVCLHFVEPGVRKGRCGGSVQIDSEGENNYVMFLVHGPQKLGVSIPGIGGHILVTAPALGGAVAICYELDASDDCSPEDGLSFSFSPTICVGVLIRRARTLNLCMKVVTKSLREIPGFPKVLDDDAFDGILVRGTKAFFLSSTGTLYGLVLQIKGLIPGKVGADSDGNASSAESNALEVHDKDGESSNIGTDSAVICSISHDEPAAVIDPAEAAAIEKVQLTGRIERMVRWDTMPSELQESNCDDSNTPTRDDQVVVLVFNRRPDSMVSALEEGVSLQACRTKLADAGHKWKLPSGAFIFVHPEQYTSVMRELQGFELKPHHVVIASSFEYLLEEAIMDVGKGAWAKVSCHRKRAKKACL